MGWPLPTIRLLPCLNKENRMDPVLKFSDGPTQFVKEAKLFCLIWDDNTFEPHVKYLKARGQNPWMSSLASLAQNGLLF